MSLQDGRNEKLGIVASGIVSRVIDGTKRTLSITAIDPHSGEAKTTTRRFKTRKAPAPARAAPLRAPTRGRNTPFVGANKCFFSRPMYRTSPVLLIQPKYRLAHPEIYVFVLFYKINLDRSIQKRFYFNLKTEALVISSQKLLSFFHKTSFSTGSKYPERYLI